MVVPRLCRGDKSRLSSAVLAARVVCLDHARRARNGVAPQSPPRLQPIATIAACSTLTAPTDAPPAGPSVNSQFLPAASTASDQGPAAALALAIAW